MELNFGEEKWYTDTQITTALDTRISRINRSKDPTALIQPSPIETAFFDFLQEHFSSLIGKKLIINPTNQFSDKVNGILEKIEQKSFSWYVLVFNSAAPWGTTKTYLLAIEDFVGKVSVILDSDQWITQKTTKKISKK